MMERKRTFAGHVRRTAFLAATALFFAASVSAQETRGRIAGRAVDTTQAPIPGASVTVLDTARGTTTSSTTNRDGLFLATYLLPGTYQVTVEVQGFKKLVKDGVRVAMNETSDLTMVLEVGGIEEAVSVTAEGAALDTSDASIGFRVDAKRLAELPLIHGDPYKIMGLATGLAHSGSQRLDRPYEPTHIVGFAYDGTRSNRSDLLIDGAPSTATANQNEVIASYVPPSDMVEEFTVQTATFDAQFGNTEGGVTSMTIKSGTNQLHGTVYYFAEPKGLAANDYFGNKRSQPRPDTSSDRPGFSLTGPLRIPGLYDGRDKTFFSVGFEHIKDVRPRFDASGDSWVPTEALRNGDFSAYAGNITIYDPLTRVPTGNGQYVGQPFPGNVIPADRISPASRAILDYYSLPKNPGLQGNINDSTLAETADYNTFTARVDQRISSANKMFARYSWYNRESNYNEYMDSVASGTWFQFKSYQAVVDDVHVFNPTTVVNVRYGYNRFERNSGQQDDALNWDMTATGFPAEYNSLFADFARRFPRLDFDGNNMLDVAYGGDFRPVTTHSVVATLNKVLARHSLKGGMELRIYREDSLSTANDQSGRYQFTNTYTRQSSASGTDYQGLQNYAAFLLGLPSTTSVERRSDYSEYSKTWGLFIQDDWRVNSKLTLNLGLRWEIETALTERNNKSVTGFDYAYVQPMEPTVQARYAALNDPALKALQPQLTTMGGLLFAGVGGQGNRLYQTPKDTFLPRFGFTYQVNPKTVVRGGVGLFAGFLGQRRGDVFPNGWSQTTTIATTFNSSGAPIPKSWDNALLTQAILEPVGNANGPQQGLGQAIDFFNQDPKVSKQLRYQIGFQRELPGGFVLDAAYVGNYGYDIEIVRNINALPNEYLNADNSRTAAMNANNAFLTGSVPNPFVGLIPGTSLNNATIARSQLLRPYPQYLDIRTTNNDGKSWYNSAQVSLQKRFSKGYTLGVSYTWSKWEQATEYLNAADAEPTRMISDLDVAHRLSVSGILELPFGKGRRFASDASGVLQAIVGGWQIQGVYTYQTGFPVPFGSFSVTGGTTTGDLFYNGGPIAIDNPTTDRWFNTEAFTSILDSSSTNATPVNHLRTFPYRLDEVRRDSINNIDLSLIKDFVIKNDVRLQVRFEFVNAFNEAYFPNPVAGQTSATFGQIAPSNQENYARRAQIGVKLVF